MSAESNLMGTFFAMRVADLVGQPITGRLTREIEYIANARGPTIVPQLESLLKTYYAGYMGTGNAARDILSEWALKHGVDFRRRQADTPQGIARQSLWNGLLDANRPHYPSSFLRKLWRQVGVQFDGDNANRRQALLIDKLRDALKKEGFPDRADQNLFMDEIEYVPLNELVLWLRLGLIDVTDFQKYASSLGFGSVDSLRMRKERFLPIGIETLLRAADMHATDDAFAARWQLDADKPDWWDKWTERAGLKYVVDPERDFGSEPVAAGQGTGGGSSQTTWADVLWRMNVRTPSLGDLAQFLHRYRGVPGQSDTYSNPDVSPITLPQASQFMDALNIPNGLKTYYFNLMYNVFNMREIRQFIKLGNRNLPQIAGWLGDNGYKSADAVMLAQALVQDQINKDNAPIFNLAKQTLNKLVRTIEASYETGTIDNGTALSELTANGVPTGVAVTVLATVDLAVQNTIVKSVIQRTKGDFFAGRVTIGQARTRLVAAGIAVSRVTQLTAGWQASFSAGRKTLATEKVLKYLRSGLLTRAQALVRLENLGWVGGDLLLLLADVDAAMKSDTAKLIAATEAKSIKEEKETEKTLQRLEGVKNSLIARIKELTPPKTLVKWYKDGIWPEDKVRSRLSLIGYPDDVIDGMLLDALHTAKPKSPSGGTAK